jgi:hypothetical protein
MNMGQQAVGILYGCEAPELPEVSSGEHPAYEVLMRWEKAERVDWLAEKPRIRFEHEGGKSLLGVWIAVGGSGEDGAPYFLEQCLTLDQVPAAFTKQIDKAAKLWGRFAEFVARTEGVTLPEPKLWLTPCETA